MARTTDTPMMQRLNEAMRTYVSETWKAHGRHFTLDAAMEERIRKARGEIRISEGGGGFCHVVSEWLQAEYGLDRMSVTYLDREGEVVIAGHLVNILADGSILDSTADQTGEGYDIRLLRQDDPEYGRYRPEFYEDYYPGHPGVKAGELDVWAGLWSGVLDVYRQDAITGERGKGWWVDDPAALVAYYTEQRDLAADDKANHGYAAVMQSWLDDLSARTVMSSSL